MLGPSRAFWTERHWSPNELQRLHSVAARRPSLTGVHGGGPAACTAHQLRDAHTSTQPGPAKAGCVSSSRTPYVLLRMHFGCTEEGPWPAPGCDKDLTTSATGLSAPSVTARSLGTVYTSIASRALGSVSRLEDQGPEKRAPPSSSNNSGRLSTRWSRGRGDIPVFHIMAQLYPCIREAAEATLVSAGPMAVVEGVRCGGLDGHLVAPAVTAGPDHLRANPSTLLGYRFKSRRQGSRPGSDSSRLVCGTLPCRVVNRIVDASGLCDMV